MTLAERNREVNRKGDKDAKMKGPETAEGWRNTQAGNQAHCTLAAIQDTAARVAAMCQHRQSNRCMLPMSANTH